MAGKVTRRSLLLGAGSLALTQLVSACQLWQQSPKFLVEFLASSIPATLLKKFQGAIEQKVILKPLPIAQLAEGRLSMPLAEPSAGPLKKLPLIGSRTQKSSPMPDVISLADGWLQDAIQRQQLQPLDLQPLNLSNTPGWKTLPKPFKSLVTRDPQGFPDDTGNLWGAPYRWGHLMMAYRTEQLDSIGQSLTDWTDLWNSDLKGRISLLDSDRVVLGLTLKSLGESVNTAALDSVSNLQERLEALNRQVKFYSSDSYLQPLLLKDTWVAVGWSTDILPLVRRDRRINAIVPKSGTILTADMWVKPVKTPSSDVASAGITSARMNFAGISSVGISSVGIRPAQARATDATPQNPSESLASANGEGVGLMDSLARQWIEFFWEPSIAQQLTLLSSGASPVLLSSRTDLPAALANDPLLMPSEDIMGKSEFLEPLSEEAIAFYRRYWSDMRRS